MQLWISQIGHTWKWDGEDKELISEPRKVSFHKGIFYIDQHNQKVQGKYIEDFENV